MRLLLLGSTDLSLAIAKRLDAIGMRPAAVVDSGEAFKISYRPQGVSNVRHANMAGWCAATGVEHVNYGGVDELAAFIEKSGMTIGLAAGWYHMIPASIRSLLPGGVLGMHASLLPQLRGGAPLNWAILSNLSETGMSLFKLGDGVDDGLIYGQRRFAVGRDDDVTALVQRAEAAALDLITECLPEIAAGTLSPRPQQGVATYALQRSPEDGAIDWARPAADIVRLVRATTKPYPGAFGMLGGEKIVIWRARPLDSPAVLGAAGQIAILPELDTPAVVTGRGLVAIDAASYGEEDALPLLKRSSNRRFERMA
jgi:methionyl-tRNA formyltransferase